MLSELSEHTVTAIDPFIKALMTNLVHSRRILSLFQHHDAITGTSRDHVVADYASK